jgi:hypothetical protein
MELVEELKKGAIYFLVFLTLSTLIKMALHKKDVL